MTESIIYKICSKCKQELSADKFTKCKRLYLGLNAWCKECCNEYQRIQKRNKDFNFTESALERFFSSFVKSDSSCWLWFQAKNRLGYGLFAFKGNVIGAHRVSWIIHNNSIPNGLFVCHKCDVRNCVNPEHLFLGTQLDNMRDCFAKGRMKNRYQRKGEEINFAKLKESDVLEIRERYKNGEKRKDLAIEFNVCVGNIDSIVTYKTWNHLP